MAQTQKSKLKAIPIHSDAAKDWRSLPGNFFRTELIPVAHEKSISRCEAENSLRKKIPITHYLSRVPGDGNGLFHALAKTLYQTTNMQTDHLSLRTVCVEQIFEDPELHGRFHDHFDLHNYISRMRRDGEYADQLCISAFCSAIKISVTVLHPFWEATEFGNHCGTDPLLIAFNGHNHFDALMLKPKRVPQKLHDHVQLTPKPRNCEANDAKPPTRTHLLYSA